MRISPVLALAPLLTLSFAAPVPVATETSLDPATAMRAAGEPYASWAAAGRRFLTFDPAGGGTAAEVVGDLGAAGRVAVLVPGVDTKLRDFDRGLGGVARRAPAVQARSLYARLRADDPAARVAVVAWLGYHPPDGVGLDAVREVRARAGAAALTGFVRGLLARYPGLAVTLIGHSYGAIVVGLAAPHLPQVADLIALGAPGMGADRAAEFGTARVWSALAPADWIRRVPQVRLLDLGHGRRPSAPGFGARPLPTDGVAGHDYYLVPGSATLAAVARIVLGAPGIATPAPKLAPAEVAPSAAKLAPAQVAPSAANVAPAQVAR